MLRYTGSAAVNRNSLPDREVASACRFPGQIATLPEVRSPSNNPIFLFDPVDSPLVVKLQNFIALRHDEIDALNGIARHARPMRADQILVHEGSPPDHLFLIVKGVACRYKMLPGGRRQIMGYLIPGDLSDVHFALSGRPDHSVALLCDAEVVRIPITRMLDVLERFPRLERSFALAALLENGILREWLLNVGQRNALQKIAHIFCEMAERMQSIGHVRDDGSFDFPINQAAMADSAGMTSVHVNRTLQRLRTDGLIRLCQRRLHILDPARLAVVAGFEPDYLHLGRSPRRAADHAARGKHAGQLAY